MKLVVGLGNPGPRAREQRHSVGFRVVDAVAQTAGIPLDRPRFGGRFGQGRWQGAEVALLQPETWMNRSGRSVEAAIAGLGLALSDLLVVVDDVDLPLGRLRLRARGGDGGQRGLGDILARTGEEVARLRFGIGRPAPGQDTAAHVLDRFSEAEAATVRRSMPRAVDAVSCWVREGITPAMDRYNATPDDAPVPESGTKSGGGSW